MIYLFNYLYIFIYIYLIIQLRVNLLYVPVDRRRNFNILSKRQNNNGFD